MKKNIVKVFVLLCCVILGAIVGNANKKQQDDIKNRKYYQAMMNYTEFDDILECADNIVEGKIKQINSYESYDEYIVTVESLYKGEAFKEISIRNYFINYVYNDGEKVVNGSTNLNYETGNSYVFVLQHIKNVYEDKYVILADTYLPVSDMKSSTYLSRNVGMADCRTYINNYSFSSDKGSGEHFSMSYIESTEEKLIMEESDVIIKLKISDLYSSTDVVDVFACEVLQTIKGEVNTTSENKIIIPFFVDTVTKNEEYVVCLHADSEDSFVYTLSSKNSIYDCETASYLLPE